MLHISIIFLNILFPMAYAEDSTTSKDETVFEITLSEQDVAKLERTLAWASERLENTCGSFQSDFNHLQEMSDTMVFTGEVTPEMFEESVQKWQDANYQLEQIRIAYQFTKNKLVERHEKLKSWSKVFQTLKTTPDEKLTDTQKQFIPTLENGIVLIAKAIYLTEQYLEILIKQLDLAIQQTILATRVHSLSREKRGELLIAEKKRALASIEATLLSEEERILRKQEDVPNQLAALEVAQANAEMIKGILDTFTREKETIDVEIKNLILEQRNIEVNLARQQKNVNTLTGSLEKLKITPPIEPEYKMLHQERITSEEKYLASQTQILELEKNYAGLINQRIKQTQKRLETEDAWNTKINTLLQTRQQQELDAKLQEEQQQYLSKAAELRWQLQDIKDPTHRYLLEMQIQQANESAQQLIRELENDYLEKQIVHWENEIRAQKSTEFSSSQLTNIQQWLEGVDTLFLKVAAAQKSLEEKIDVLSKQSQVVEKRSSVLEGEQKQYGDEAITVISGLEKNFRAESAKLAPLQEKGEEIKVALTEMYKKALGYALFSPRELPKSALAWQDLWNEYRLIPDLFVQQSKLVWSDFLQAIQQTNIQQGIMVSALILLWLGFMFWVKISSAWVNNPGVDNFASRLTLLLRLVQMNIFGIMFTGVFLIVVWLIQPNIASVLIVLTLLLGGLLSKLLINLSWLLLSGDFPKQQKIYNRFRYLVIFLGLLAVIISLIYREHEGLSIKFSFTAQDVLDSVFMILLFSIIWTLSRIREAVFFALNKHENVKGYIRIATHLATFLMPLSILVVSFLGLIGYTQLGWLIIKQVSFFFLVLVGWLIVRGFIDDFMTLWKNRAFEQGRIVLAEDFIPLFDKLLGIILFIQATFVLLYISGWIKDVAFKESLSGTLTYKLFSIGSTEITLGPILLSFVLLWVVFWLGSWSRGVSYRWVYAGIADKGVRHSLSVFTQYAVVVVGLLIVLKGIGIDPTMLTVFAGALGVGIGFGMQNLVNNFISGILLLIERPVRTGDFVNIDSHWGTVTRIGIRSLTIENADMEDVLVPNSAVISATFINRTHSNTLLRQGFYVGISFNDSPQLAKKIIQQILEADSDVLKNPSYEILLWEFAEFKMTFRVRYLVDVAACDRFQVNSRILDNVLFSLREAGIEIPCPKEEVNLRLIEDKTEKPAIIVPRY